MMLLNQLEQYERYAKEKKKKRHWAIRNDLIVVILFVIFSAAWYKTVIEGAYWGIALHAVGEMNNESYKYWSDEEEDEHSDESSVGFQDREIKD